MAFNEFAVRSATVRSHDTLVISLLMSRRIVIPCTVVSSRCWVAVCWNSITSAVVMHGGNALPYVYCQNARWLYVCAVSSKFLKYMMTWLVTHVYRIAITAWLMKSLPVSWSDALWRLPRVITDWWYSRRGDCRTKFGWSTAIARCCWFRQD